MTYRDLRVLQDAGHPITGDERGRLSRPRLISSKMPDIRFSNTELDALLLAVAQAFSRRLSFRQTRILIPKSAAAMDLVCHGKIRQMLCFAFERIRRRTCANACGNRAKT